MSTQSTTQQASETQFLNEIDRVFRLEIETLKAVKECLGPSYAQAADILFNCKGKVVVTGMGKSGLIAQKIASTMVSTGTVATFLHPSDALHGDAGIVGKDDVILAISKSGQTEELLQLLPFFNQIQVPVITITANTESTLAKCSSLVLFTPVDIEACPLDLAPTSSTTAALVVGDALAMALMKRRGFTPQHFAVLHPGGRLGKQLLLTVEGVMRSGKNNPVINVGDSVPEMLYSISNKLSGAVSVVDDNGRLVGLVTDRDIRTVLEKGGDIFSMGIGEIMNSKPTFIYSDEMAITALEEMENRKRPFVVLPVVNRESNSVVGMIHLHDLVAQGL